MFRLLLQLHPEAATAVVGAVDQTAPVPAATAATAPSPLLLPTEHPDWTQRRLIRAELHLFRIDRNAAAAAAAAAATAAAAHSTAKTTAATAAATNDDNAVDSRATTPVQTDNDAATSDPAAATVVAATAVPVSPLPPQPPDSRQLLVVAVPHLLSSSHLLLELAGLGFSTVAGATRIVSPRSGQHSLLLRFHSSADAGTFFQRIHNHPFHALRREVAYVFQLADGAAVEERAIDPALAALSPSEAPQPVVPAAGSLELPCCPRCLSKLDSSLTEIVSELEDCSLVRVRSRRAAAAAGGSQQQWRTHRVPIWPEIHCATCTAVAAHASANPSSQTDARTACRACIAAPVGSSAEAAAAGDGCAAADSAQSLSRSTSTVHSSDNSLWICLLCSHLGCGRYASSGAAHAFAHHLATGHNWAMEISMGAIWDYRNDGYIHRVHGAAATAASAAAAAAAASIAESAARSQAASRARKSSAATGGEQKEDPAGASASSSSGDDSDAEQQQQLLHWSRWNEMPAASSSASAAAGPTTSAPSALTRSSSAGFSLTSGDGDAPSAASPGAAAAAAELTALSLSAAASTPDDMLPSYGLDSEEASALLHSKLESIASFYNHLLTHTLQEQYEFFTRAMAERKDEDREQSEKWEPIVAAQTARDREAAARIGMEIEALDASNRALDRSVRDLSARVAKLNEENAFVKDLNTRMLQDQMAARKASATAAAAAAASPVKSAAAASTPSTPAAASSSAASSPSPAPSTPAASSTAASAAASSSSPPPPSTPVTAAAAASSAAASAVASPSAASSSASPSSAVADLHLQLDPSLVSKYAQLRDQKARRLAALEKEVAQLMSAIEAKSAKETAAAAAKEAARKERVKRSMVGGIGAGGAGGGANSSASSRGRRG